MVCNGRQRCRPFYLTRLPGLVNLGQVELVGPVDQALGRLMIVHLVGRGGCRVQLYYCARLRLGSGSGQSGGGLSLAAPTNAIIGVLC